MKNTYQKRFFLYIYLIILWKNDKNIKNYCFLNQKL